MAIDDSEFDFQKALKALQSSYEDRSICIELYRNDKKIITAIARVVLKAFYKTACPIISTCLYLLLGWLVVIAVKPLFDRMPIARLYLLVAGGLSYTAGVAFFATDSRIPYGQLIWHLSVIPGTACHYVVILNYAA